MSKDDPKIKEASLVASSTSVGSLKLGIIINLSVQWLLSSAFFTKSALEIENSGDETRRSEYRYYCITAITNAFASVEANINEFYFKARDRQLTKDLSPEFITLLSKHWETIKGIPSLEKYQYALMLTRKLPFEPGEHPYQPMDDLRSLRNAIIHFVPEVDYKQKKHKEVGERLRSYRFELNPFLKDTGNPFFPSKCFSRGCAEWSFNTAIEFIDSFYDKLGLPSNLEPHKKSLKIEL